MLKSEIQMRQGYDSEAIATASFTLPSEFGSSDIAVWQDLALGSALAYDFKFDTARDALARAHDLASKSQPQLLGEVLLRQGTLASMQRQPEQARALYQECLAFALAHRDQYLEASARGSLGLNSNRMEHYDEAIQWNQQAIELDQANGWLGLAAKAEGNIGMSYDLVGDLVNALAYYEKANKRDIDAGAPERRVTWLSAAGEVLYELQDYSAAEKKSSEALAIAESLKSDDDAIYCLNNLALISFARGQMQKAQAYVDDALRRETSAPDPTRDLYTRLIIANLALKTGKLKVAESSFLKIVSHPKALESVRWEARAGLAQTLAAQHRPDEANRQFLRAIETISGARDSIRQEDSRISFLSSAIRFYDAYVNFLIDRGQKVEALQVADLSRAQALASGLKGAGSAISDSKPKNLSTAALKQIAKGLNATICFYWLGQEKSWLWVVSQNSVMLVPFSAGSEIGSLVASYRKSMDPQRLLDPLESLNPDGQKLYDILVRPAEKLIPKDSRVIILPDGSLAGLNFETLIVSGPQPHYWIDDVTVSVANSLSLLAQSRADLRPSASKLLFFGDAISASKDFPPLADSHQELTALSKHFSTANSTFFTRELATPRNYLSSDPGRYSFLHFATHGTASIPRPLESAIILSPENDGSYKLYARDILQHPLNAYLVSISACNGQGERVFAGEGLVGLSWAFLRAGAHNVVAGLWEVSTSSAPPIFDRLYEGVTNGEDPATALRNAKLSLVHSKTPQRRPFYWAPFQLYSGS